MLIDRKVQMLLASSDYIKSKLAQKYIKGTIIYGSSQVEAGTYFDILDYLLGLPYITGSLKSEIYKKTKGLIDSMGIVPKIGENPGEPSLVNDWVFHGSAEPGLSGIALQAELEANFVHVASMNLEFSPNHQVYYFAYRAVFEPLTNIKDQNQFLTLGGWEMRIESFNINGVAVPYRVYAFKNYTTQTSFTNFFNF